MTDSLSRRNKANKRKGAQFESDVRDHLRTLGYEVERLRLTGKNDEGDLALRLGDYTLVIEAKNTAKHDLARFVEESEREALNYAENRDQDLRKAIPVVLIKRRNKTISDSYAVVRLDTLLRIIGI